MNSCRLLVCMLTPVSTVHTIYSLSNAKVTPVRHAHTQGHYTDFFLAKILVCLFILYTVLAIQINVNSHSY